MNRSPSIHISCKQYSSATSRKKGLLLGLAVAIPLLITTILSNPLTAIGDHQRGREPEGLAVGVLHENAVIEEVQAHVLGGADRGVDVDASPQARTLD